MGVVVVREGAKPVVKAEVGERAVVASRRKYFMVECSLFWFCVWCMLSKYVQYKLFFIGMLKILLSYACKFKFFDPLILISSTYQTLR